MTYQEYKKERQEECNKLPLKFAFSNEQFKQAMAEWGFKEDDYDKIYKFGQGFYRREDSHIIKAYIENVEKANKEHEKRMTDDKDYRIDAFLYEMNNHEYLINWQRDWDVCSCFVDFELPYLDDTEYEPYKSYLKLMNHEEWISEYELAIKKHKELANKNDWY